VVLDVGAAVLGATFKCFPFAMMFALVWFLSMGVRDMLYADPAFQVTRVTVFPSGILTDSEITYLEDTTRNASLLEISLERVSQDLSLNPKVKQAVVTRVFPTELSILITPRTPFVQVQFKPNGPYYSVSYDQVVIERASSLKPVPIILEDYGARKKSYNPGQVYESKRFGVFLELLDFVKTNALFKTESVARIAVDRLGNWTLVLSDGVSITLGKEALLSAGKQEVLKTLFKSKDRADLLYVDARYQDIVIKKK